MNSQQLALFIFLCLHALLSACSMATARDFENTELITNFVNQMVSRHNFDAADLKNLLRQARLRQEILEAIARPVEAKPWHKYRPIFVNNSRIDGGREFWNDNKKILAKVTNIYNIPAAIIVAIIGVETRYGGNTGRFPVLDSLSTLAFAYPPRSHFFRGELENYLLMTREEHMDPLAQLGSYAGAMGIPQFISSSFRRYAVDFDQDGRRDLWNNTSDAIASVANYLKVHGWKNKQPIATRVKVHGDRYRSLLKHGLKPRWTQQQLLLNGVAVPGNLPKDMQGILIELNNGNETEYWVGWHNFYIITRYNNSALYAMAVYQLSEQVQKTLNEKTN